MTELDQEEIKKILHHLQRTDHCELFAKKFLKEGRLINEVYVRRNRGYYLSLRDLLMSGIKFTLDIKGGKIVVNTEEGLALIYTDNSLRPIKIEQISDEMSNALSVRYLKDEEESKK